MGVGIGSGSGTSGLKAEFVSKGGPSLRKAKWLKTGRRDECSRLH